MPLDGVLYTVADYVPCLNCTDVRLVDAVWIAELTDDVRAAIAAGRLPDPPCEVCGVPLPCGQPLLLSTPGPGPKVLLGSISAEPDVGLAGRLLRILKARRASWPAADPDELHVVPRDDLTGAQRTYGIPPALWDAPPGPLLEAAGREQLRTAWDHVLGFQRSLLDAPPPRMEAELARKLAQACIRSFQALGDPAALTEARTAIVQALSAAASPGERARALSLRGTVAVVEHERRGEAELAREAVAAFRAALELDPGNGVAASGLGTALRLLQSWDGDAASLDEGIETLRRAVAEGGDRAVRLNNLGSVLSTRGADRDLAEAAVALTEAVELTPSASPDLAARLNNLGTVHARAGALTAAVAAFDAAVAATVARDPDRPGRGANLAAALWRRDAPGDAARATSLSREAAEGHADDPADALRAACSWGRNAFRLEAWAEVTEAYEHVLAISDLLLDRQLTGEARRARLREVQGLPDLAAFAHATLGDGVAAGRALAAGRGRLLADALELVAAGVETADPALVARREQVVREVERAERAIEDADGERRVELAADARRLREELAGVMAEIAPAPAGAADAPLVSPLVSVACTPAGTVASVGTRLVWAPGLTSAEVERLATLDVEAALDTLGAELAGPLAPLLAGHDVVTFSLPAALARLPLAAAPFTVGGARRRLIDDHATALLPAAAAVPVPATAAPRLGGVANPARAGLRPLQCAASELSTAAARLPAEDADVLVGADATVERLLTTLGRCSHLHLACHGEFRADDPLESCLLLADGDLSLRPMQRVDRPAELSLLVLSACESAQSDTEVLPDELIGLPTAFLQLGARAVVGALWPIPDLPTSLLMGRFYLHLAADEVAPAEALRRAQNWLRAATAGELATVLDVAPDPFVRRAAGVIRGQFAPEDRPFASPSVWAAFVSFGASA